jgi:hypothetical protein
MLTLPISALSSPLRAKEVMVYKEQIKVTELITKIRIIRFVKKEHLPIGQVAMPFSCHRNTIRRVPSSSLVLGQLGSPHALKLYICLYHTVLDNLTIYMVYLLVSAIMFSMLSSSVSDRKLTAQHNRISFPMNASSGSYGLHICNYGNCSASLP